MSVAKPKPTSSPIKLRADSDNSLSTSLANIYIDYSKNANGIDGSRFLKFCKDASLFDSKFRPEDLDIVFTKFKEKGSRALSFEGFSSALVSIANRKNISTETMLKRIIDASPSARPTSATVVPQPNRFHDDQNTYTGVHKVGGPTIIDLHHRDLSQMVDRKIKSNMDWQLEKGLQSLNIQCDTNVKSKSNHQNVIGSPCAVSSVPLSPMNKPKTNKYGNVESASKSKDATRISADVSAGAGIRDFYGVQDNESCAVPQELKHTFNDYAVKTVSIYGGGIDGAKFLKFCRDVYLFDSNFRPQDLDVVFAKYKEQELRHLSYRGFISALADIADRKNVDFDVLVHHILSIRPSARPSPGSVVPLPNRFHDDQTTYTGNNQHSQFFIF